MANGLDGIDKKKIGMAIGKKLLNSMADFRRGYNFIVFFEENMVSFKNISGLSMEMEMETLQEGGRNGFAYSLNKPRTAENTLSLSKGLVEGEMEFKLYRPGYQFKKEIEIYVLGRLHVPVKAYYLDGCAIKKISVEGLDAESSQIMIGNVEIIYRSMEEVGIPLVGAWRDI